MSTLGSELMNIKSASSLKILSIILLIGLLVSTMPTTPGNAQSSGLGWDAPVNVSQMGSTALSVIASDSEDHIHVFWDDTLSDQGYAQWNGIEWLPSVSVQFNFAEAAPQMLNDQNGNLFAFWIDPLGDLLTSRTLAENAGNPNAWSSPQTIANEVIAFSASIGNNGNLYIVYLIGLSAEGMPAGVYMRVNTTAGARWEAETIIYQSQYFRNLTVNNAHVNISVNKGASQDTVYISWDDPSLKRVYLAKSADEGVTWSEPIEIDGPKGGEIPPLPFNINTYAYGDNLLVLWQTNLQSSFDCTQNYRFSSNSGESWDGSDVLFENLVGCPQSINLLPGPDGLVMLMSTIQDTRYLIAWDGTMWSEPQPQLILTSFSDPVSDTLVKLGCLQPVVTSNSTLYVVGCDTVGNGDTWVLSRSLGTKTDWFPPTNSWKTPVTFVSRSDSIDQLQVVSDDKNVFHAVWRESTVPITSDAKDKIFYAQFDGSAWSSPLEIVNIPDKNIGEINLAYDKDGFLYLVWSGKTKGQIYFAWANSTRAISRFEWSDPILLPTSGIVTSPSISEGIDGELIISYVIPINENRGVYLIKSTDNGVTWSQPTMIFDATQAGWEMVGQPYVIEYAKNYLNAIWTQKSILASENSIGLYASNSRDGGVTWESAQQVDQTSIQTIWLERTGAGILHRLWEGDKFQNPGLWHEFSLDGGYSWQRLIPVSILGEIGGAAVTYDETGHVHIVQSFRSDQKQPAIVHLWWDGSNWNAGETLQYPQVNQLPVQEIAAAVDTQGKILLLLVNEKFDQNTQSTLQEIAYSFRVFDGEPVDIVPTFESTPPIITAVPSNVVTPTSFESIPTQTPTTLAPNLDVSEPSRSNSTQVIIIAVVASVIFILGGMLIIVLRK